jgi:signal transduction histidine kinase
MRLNYFFSFLLFVICNDLFAQNKAIENRLVEIEKTKASNELVNELKKILSTPNLSNEENLAIQTTLVHQYQALHLWDTCLNYCQAQVALAHQQKNSFAEATFYKLIGGTYYYIPKKENAIAYWNKCIALAEPNNYHTLLAQCYHNVGVICLESGKDLDIAENYFIKAIELSKKNNDTSSTTFSLHYRLLATTYDRENKLDKAEKIYKEIIVKSRTLKDSANLVEGLLFYTNVLRKKKEFQKAVSLSEEALYIARKINLIDGEITALDTHAENLIFAGNFKDAYQFQSDENTLLRKRFDGDLNTKIGEAEAKFKNAETTHEKEVAILNAKKEKQIYLFGCIGLLSIVGFIFYYLVQKRNAKQKAALVQAQIQSVLDGEEKERTRIAKDLHDGIVQDLTAIKLQLNAGVNNESVVDKKIVVDAVESIDKASKEVRNISYQMMPTTLIQLGFIPAIEDLLKRVLTPSNIQYDFEQIGVAERLPDNIEVSIFRITQELLNNVIKHSEANFVSLLITLKANVVTMIFEDNGKGFDAATIKKGIGFSSLSSRVELLNGDIKYEKADGVGTMAIVKIPISI